MQRPIFAHGVLEHEIEHRSRGLSQAAIALDQRAGKGLVVPPNCGLSFGKESAGIVHGNFPAVRKAIQDQLDERRARILPELSEAID